MKFLDKMGFGDRKQLAGFLTVALSGQLIYSGFEAFKATFYTSLIEVLGVTNTQMGLLFTLIGSAMFFYVPAGWVNNRFAPRQILICSLIARFIGMTYIVLTPNTHFNALMIIAASWGLVDAIFWPAVLNGTRQFAGEGKEGIAFGLLESIRRFAEMSMNAAALIAISVLGSGAMIFRGVMGFYTLLIVLVVIAVWKYVPDTREKNAESSISEKNKEALKGLIQVLKMPDVWLTGMVALTVYWSYIQLIYSVPYMETVFGLTRTQASIFGLLNASAMGILGGLISGTVSDFVFKSPTRMLFSSLVLSSVAMVGVLVLPMNASMLIPNLVLLALFSFATFLARSVFFAPIAELKISKSVSGSAMSVASFLCYMPVFFAYGLNGWILDNYEPVAAYQLIFTIALGATLFGTVSSAFLMKRISAHKLKQAENDLKLQESAA